MTKNLDHLTKAERIEYKLGKDRFPDLFFYPHIPEAWEIPTAVTHFHDGKTDWRDLKNTTIEHDGVEYQFNNLGYRCHYDYHVEELKTKKNILCVGDSDVYGPNKHYEDLWCTQLQKKLPDYNIVPLGAPSWADDTLTRTTVCTVKALGDSIKHVCLMWPGMSRREFVKKDYKRILHNAAPVDIPYEEFWDHLDWVNNNYNYTKNQNLVKFICEAYGISFVDLLVITNGKNNEFEGDGDRFGKGIFGVNSHMAFTNYFYKKIMNQPGLYESLKHKK
jgi:hypothetical protein